MLAVAITQPYLPAYRVPLFDALDGLLRDSGLAMTVYSGLPTGEQAGRGDATTAAWHRPFHSRRIRVTKWDVDLRRLPSDARNVDVLVSELEALNLLAWRWSLTRRPLILWGHGKAFVQRASSVGDRVEWQLARRADHLMTYSGSGRDFLVSHGRITPSKVTAIGNSTDTATLRSELTSLSPDRLETLRKQSGFGPRALFVGGLDSSKRIAFLLDAARAALKLDPTFRLVVVGQGILKKDVEAFSVETQAVDYFPSARGAQLAELAASCHAIWMPGRVGLVAVDALALGLKVFTVAHDHHAPEIEFLQHNEIKYLPDEPSAFGMGALDEMKSESLWPGRELRVTIPTVESVAREMHAVILGVLEKRDAF